MKKIIVLAILFTLFGCSAKNSATKNGAILGATAGVLAGGVLGVGLSKQHVGNGKTTQSALIGALIVGTLGLASGAGLGFVIDEVKEKDDNKIQHIIYTQNIEEIQ